MGNLTSQVFHILIIIALAVFLYALLFTGFDMAWENIGKPIDEQADSSLQMVDGEAPRGGLMETSGRVVILNCCLAYNDYLIVPNVNSVMDWNDGTSSCTVELRK